jgi:hypothetical protein
LAGTVQRFLLNLKVPVTKLLTTDWVSSINSSGIGDIDAKKLN